MGVSGSRSCRRANESVAACACFREGRGIFPQLTVAENVDAVAAQNCGREPMFDPTAIYSLFPVMDERRSSIAGKLSGGQQQMLALSLAVCLARRVA